MYKHGGKGTRLYRIWKGMRTRCNNPNFPHYKYYGAKGVSVCSDWNDFAKFRDWALSHGYSTDLTIDRINSDGDYCPDNCEWITLAEQSRRRNYTTKYWWNGQWQSLGEISTATGIEYQTLRKRIIYCGLSVNEAINYIKYSKPTLIGNHNASSK